MYTYTVREGGGEKAEDKEEREEATENLYMRRIEPWG